MGEEVSSLGHQRREIEDQELEVMEALEPLDQELAALKGERLLDGRGAGSRPRAARASQRPRSTTRRPRSARLGTSWRRGLRPSLRPPTSASRAKLGGIGAAHVVGGACSGCHLQLPAGELHRLRHSAPDSVVYCDQCGRILVP